MAGLTDLIPFGIGSAVSGIATGIAGIAELGAAKKQTQQGEQEQQDAKNLQKAPLRPEFQQAYNAAQEASTSPMPGLQMYQQMLQQNYANQMKAIHLSSPNGASAVNAINLALGTTNNATNTLAAQNAQYQGGLAKEARSDLWNIGTEQHELEKEQYSKQQEMQRQANALLAAGTANKQTAINTITGAVGGTAANIANQANQDNLFNQYLSKKYGNTNTTSSSNTGIGSTAADTSFPIPFSMNPTY